MQKRLFIGVPMPDDIKKKLAKIIEREYHDLPVRWGRKENLHLTLSFLGYVQEEAIPEICRNIDEAVKNIEIFDLNFGKIDFGPSEENKKMIWLVGEKSKALGELKFNLDKELGFFIRERRELKPHATLGRIRKKMWVKLNPEPEIKKDFKVGFSVISVDLMESKFEKGKRVYYTLESFPLK